MIASWRLPAISCWLRRMAPPLFVGYFLLSNNNGPSGGPLLALHLALLLLLTSQPAFGTTRALGHSYSFDVMVEEMEVMAIS